MQKFVFWLDDAAVNTGVGGIFFKNDLSKVFQKISAASRKVVGIVVDEGKDTIEILIDKQLEEGD